MDPQSDRFIRNKMFFGLEGFHKLQESFVAVVGSGALGPMPQRRLRGRALDGCVSLIATR